MRAILIALLAAAVVSGCSAERVVRQPGVDVDTQELRAIKEQAGIEPCKSASAEAASAGLPDVTLPCLGGGPGVNPARLRGPMVVNLWAQWCGPCRRELPIYQEFFKRYADKVGVLGVDWQDTQPVLALRLAAKSGVTYPLVADSSGKLRAQGLPRLILLDSNGSVAYEQYVEIKSLGQLETLVRTHLGVTSD